MRDGGASFLPERLPVVSDRGNAWLRPLWLVTLLFALLSVAAGTVFILRDAYQHDPAFFRLGLNSVVENDGSVTIETFDDEAAGGSVPQGSRITRVNGAPVPRDTRIWDLAQMLDAAEEESMRLDIALPDGSTTQRRITPSMEYHITAEEGVPVARDTRVAARVAISDIACLALIACAALLYLRRPRDSVALVFSFSFLLFAATVDPALALWLAAGWGDVLDVLLVIGWALLVTGLVTFPDGAFAPRWLRFVLPALPFAMIVLAIDTTPVWLNLLVAFGLPLAALITTQWRKYRHYTPGIERQQIKWAVFGFASGLLLLTAALVLVEVLPENDPLEPLWALLAVALLQGGFLAMAMGLFVSLIRFRLWEADRVISKSAVSAAVTLFVAVVWTMSMDFVKNGVELVLGEGNTAIATMAGAVLAAGIFTPTQAVALKWTKQRLQSNQDRIQKLIARLAAWRSAESPAEIAQRALAALAQAAHAGSGAILVDTSRGRALLSARGLDQPETLEAPTWSPERDDRFPVVLTLEDDDGPIGLLLAGPRSDNNRYNSDEMQSFRMLVEPLAEALRTARRRAEETETVHRVLGSVEERLARLEGGGPRLSPT